MNNNYIEDSGLQVGFYARVGNASQLTEGTLWKAALYARLSREDGDKEESDSISNQKDLLNSYVKGKQDIEVVSVYEDDGYTGVNFQRPDFQKMMNEIQVGNINCVIVKDLSRLGRNHIEMGKLLERFFPFMGVRFIAVNEGYDSLTPNQTDGLIIPFKNLVNDAYCADTSRKIRSQFEVKRKNGEYIGPFVAYGYTKDPKDHHRLLIDEDAAQIVQNIFAWKIGGMSLQGIANRLNEKGVPSPLEHKKQNGSKYKTKFQANPRAVWTPVAVGRILKNELYAGVLTQGATTTPNYKVKRRIMRAVQERVRVEQSEYAIISAEDFALVNTLLRKDTRVAPGSNTVYLFSGMLYCGDCGQNLVRKNVPSSKQKNVYHICSTYKKGKGCKSHSISEKALYEAVFHMVTLHIRECAKIGEVLAFIGDMPMQQINAQGIQRQIEAKKAEVAKLGRRQVRLFEDYDDGLMNRDEYTNMKAIFSAQADEAEKALELLMQELDNIIHNRTENSRWIEHFKKYHNLQSLTRSAVVELIERIIVYEGGKIEVVPRYKADFEDALRYIESLSADSLSSERRAM